MRLDSPESDDEHLFVDCGNELLRRNMNGEHEAWGSKRLTLMLLATTEELRETNRFACDSVNVHGTARVQIIRMKIVEAREPACC